jgi:acyl-CoA thioester hydrolase
MQALYNAETKALHSVAVTKGVWFDVHRNRPARVPDVQHLEAMIFKPSLNG